MANHAESASWFVGRLVGPMGGRWDGQSVEGSDERSVAWSVERMVGTEIWNGKSQ